MIVPGSPAFGCALMKYPVRSFLSVRTLMDSSVEIWSEDEFNNVQHALKNRVLEDRSRFPGSFLPWSGIM